MSPFFIQCRKVARRCPIWCQLFLMLVAVVSAKFDGNPPKVLPRLMAGFYTYHPSYNSDVPEKVKTIKQTNNSTTNSTTTTEMVKSIKLSSVKNVHHYHFHEEDDFSGHNEVDYDYKKKGGRFKKVYPKTYKKKRKKKKKSKSEKPKHYLPYKYSKQYKRVKSRIRYRLPTHSDHHHLPYWDHMAYYLNGYTLLAQKMAKYYGQKYNYPVDTLYWQIIDVMF